MKQIKSVLILLIILFCVKCAFTQNTRNAEPPTTLSKNEVGNFKYDTVVNVAGALKKELYTRAKNWIHTTVRTSDNTVQFNDISFSEIRTDMTIAMLKKIEELTFYLVEQNKRIEALEAENEMLNNN